MVTDDPFQEPTRPIARDMAPSPILRVHSAADLSNPYTPHTDTTHSRTPEDEAHGPTLPVPGVRTPRRVQWTADHVVNLQPMAHDVQPDQQVTQSNIEDVNDALEQFKTRRYRPSQLSMASAASSGSEEGRHTYPPNPASEEDYDYRLDTDDPDKDTGEFEHHLLDSGVNEHVNTFIPPGETDGLPSVPTATQEETPADKAADLVRQHTSRWGNLRRRVKSGSVKKKGERRDREREEMTEKPRHSEDSVEPLNPPIHARLNPPTGSGLPHMPGGTSVLSTLLALYGQQHSGATSGTTTAVTTPVSSRPPSVISTDDEATSQKKSIWGKKERISEDDRGKPFDEGKRNRSSTSIADRESPLQSPGLRGTFQRAAHSWRQSDRPKAARSDAGVFGALIQNAGGMTAAAAPSSATLIPVAKKPGYHLSRYSLPSSPVIGPQRAPGEGSRPASAYSSTLADHSPAANDEPPRSASSDNLIMMKKPVKSSDDLASMKKDKKGSMLNLKSLEKGTAAFRNNAEHWMMNKSRPQTPMKELTEDELKRKEWEAEKRRRKKEKAKRKKQEVFIIQHVAAILARQHFIMKLARCLMMFGSPSHRLETQIQATARVLEINAQVVYIPGTILISFGDDATHTSETKFLKQTTGLDLGKLLRVHNVYWDVVHDKVSVDDANKDLDTLMTMPPRYNTWQTILVGMLCSSFIVVPSFHGSFIDALMAAPLGGLLIIIQVLAAKNDMFSNVFEITIATLISFLSAVLASTDYFCFTALVSGGVVLILPGYIVLTGALELASRNITAGAVRIGYSVIYSLFLGFGVSIGAEIYTKIRNKGVQNVNDWACKATHYDNAPWYMTEPSQYWYFLCVPGYALWLSLRNQQPIMRKELPVMILVACAGWVVNFFSAKAFKGRADIVSALGAFTVGLLGNLYGRFLSNGASFPVMVTGILMQLPSGLANGGIFNFAAQGQTKTQEGADVQTDSQQQWSSGFSVAQQLVSVAIGLTVGLFVAAVVTHPLGGSRRRGAGIFSF